MKNLFESIGEQSRSRNFLSDHSQTSGIKDIKIEVSV